MELDKLDKVAMHARSLENRAAGSVHQQQQNLAQSTSRRTQLEQFKQEYEQRLAVLAGDGMDARQLVEYRRFLHNLNDAIKAQDQEVTRGANELQASRDELVDRSARRTAVDELIGRGRAALGQLESRREQRLSDESALQRYQKP